MGRLEPVHGLALESRARLRCCRSSCGQGRTEARAEATVQFLKLPEKPAEARSRSMLLMLLRTGRMS